MFTMWIFPIQEKIPMVEPGIKLGNFMISSQNLWLLDHEAGHSGWMLNLLVYHVTRRL
jgi:hypothetical protein